jgi:hypothetical protein
MRKKGLMVGALLILVLSLPGLVLSQTRAALWDGTQWKDLPQETKIGYVKGVGNLADYEMAASGKRSGAVCRTLDEQWKNKAITVIIQEVDKFYQENPQKMTVPVIEVMLRCCRGLAIP